MKNVWLIYVIAALLCGACGSKTEDTKAEDPKKKGPAPVREKENGQEAQARDKAHPAPTSDTPAPPEASQSADADAAKRCQGDPNPCVTDTLFEILGMLQEYNGRGSSLAGRLTTARSVSSTPVTEMPMIRKGSINTQAMG